MSDHGAVLSGDAVKGGNVSLGDHQNVNGSLRIDVAEGQNGVILIYLGGRNITRCDLTEQTHKKYRPFVAHSKYLPFVYREKLDKCMAMRYNVNTVTVIISKRRTSVNGSNERFDHR
jgi:hypothetical protein